MSRAQITAQRHRQQAIQQRHDNDRRERLRALFARTTSNVGVYDPVPPYSGPKQFELYHPFVAEQLKAGVQLLGRPPVPFIVKRDEHLFLPYGGFRVEWRGHEVGRHLSYPDYGVCRRLREQARERAGTAKLRQLLTTIESVQ